MMTVVTLMGAGGKMGCRITDNLKNSDYSMRYVEVSPQGIQNLAQRGLAPTPAESAVPEADILILAVPDRLIKKISSEVIPQMKTGALVVVLDPAAPHGDDLAIRGNLRYFVTHPCHPSIFNAESDPEARGDFFGGVKAKQHIVCTLMHGTEADYERGVALARKMFAPVTNAYRLTVEQMALLEPGLAESLTNTLLAAIHEALEEVVKTGVPEEAAREFLLGHLNVALAIIFKQIPSPFSDGCQKAMARAKDVLLKPDWKKVLQPEYVYQEIKAITGG